ncbi:oligoribonuclease [Candidatus Saccharibacteria bacterium]|nr:oligoribonuclease [Candidatus Saccharibacteria bacterium]
MTKKASLLWIDLEMTGLDPIKDRIIEVGIIATDWDFNEIARFEAAVKVDDKLVKKRLAGEFWEKNAVARDELLKQNAEAKKKAKAVENELLKFLDENFDLTQPIYLAGNSIHQDQKFIEREWPRLNARLHYRQLDVTAWKIILENRGIHFIKPEAHRAMSDIEGSIAELKYYLKKAKF